jgi:hypothetical protein
MKPIITIRIVTAAVVLTAVSGCVKHALDVEPVGLYTPANYWRNEADVIAGVNGIYNVLTQEEGVGHNLYAFDDASDDISVDGDHSDFWEIERFTANSTTYQLHPTWGWAYEQIARSNNVLIYTPRVPVMNEEIRNRSMGEAYFLRAHGYWTLNLIFGEVPLILEDNVLSGEYNIPKSSVDSVRFLIESDLLKAADLLPESYGDADKGRVTKGSAWGLLSKLYLFWEKLDKAKEFGEKVINNPNYALATEYADNFTLGKQEASSELLFAVWNKNNYNNSPINIYFTPRAWNGWGFHHPTENFVEEFENNDKRKKVTILEVGDSIPNQTTLIEITDKDAFQMFTGKEGQKTGRMLPSNSLTTGYCLRKYTAYNIDGSGNLDGNLKQPLLRTADIYLVVAETNIRLSGAGAGDAQINTIRKRAGLAEIHGAGMQELIHERRMELGAENSRFYDLVRWDKAQIIDVANDIFAKPKKASPLPPYNGAVVVPERVFVRPKNYYFPVPQVIIDQSKGIIKQNSNY